MSDRVEGDPAALEAASEELEATRPGVREALEGYREALAAFRAAEPNDVGGPQLADLSWELEECEDEGARRDAVPRAFAQGLREADRFAAEAGNAVWDWASDRLTDPWFVFGNLGLGFGFGTPAAVAKWATMPNLEFTATGFELERVGPLRKWADTRLRGVLGEADVWHRWGPRLKWAGGALGVGLSGVSQVLEDWGDPTLTGGDRVARTGGAMATEGLAGVGAAAAGAKIGAAAGVFGGPLGMAAGAVIGGVAFGIAGSELGDAAFERLEQWGVWDTAGYWADATGAAVGDWADAKGAAVGDLAGGAAEVGADLADGALEGGGELLESAGEALAGLFD